MFYIHRGACSPRMVSYDFSRYSPYSKTAHTTVRHFLWVVSKACSVLITYCDQYCLAFAGPSSISCNKMLWTCFSLVSMSRVKRLLGLGRASIGGESNCYCSVSSALTSLSFSHTKRKVSCFPISSSTARLGLQKSIRPIYIRSRDQETTGVPLRLYGNVLRRSLSSLLSM